MFFAYLCSFMLIYAHSLGGDALLCDALLWGYLYDALCMMLFVWGYFVYRELLNHAPTSLQARFFSVLALRKGGAKPPTAS